MMFHFRSYFVVATAALQFKIPNRSIILLKERNYMHTKRPVAAGWDLQSPDTSKPKD